MRTVLVTGAGAGIGAATAHRFAREGDRVAVHWAYDRARAEATRAALPGTGHVLVSGDLALESGAESAFEESIEALGSLDVLVLNAGMAPTAANRHRPDGVAYDAFRAVFRSMVEVNLLGPAALAWLMADHLVGRGSPGAIVAVGSRGAFRGEPDHPAYAASKAGLHALAQSLAVGLAPHRIQVAAVAPGFIATPRQTAKLAGPDGDAIRSQSPYGRVGTPEEIAAAVHWLASPEAAWSTGTILDANGASYLRS